MEDFNQIFSPHQQSNELSSLDSMIAASQIALLISISIFFVVSIYAIIRGFDVLPYVTDGSAFGCSPAQIEVEGFQS